MSVLFLVFSLLSTTEHLHIWEHVWYLRCSWFYQYYYNYHNHLSSSPFLQRRKKKMILGSRTALSQITRLVSWSKSPAWVSDFEFSAFLEYSTCLSHLVTSACCSVNNISNLRVWGTQTNDLFSQFEKPYSICFFHDQSSGPGQLQRGDVQNNFEHALLCFKNFNSLSKT